MEAADPLVEDKVVDEETGEGRAGGGGGGGEVAVGVAPREEDGSGDGLAAGTEAGFRSTCNEEEFKLVNVDHPHSHLNRHLCSVESQLRLPSAHTLLGLVVDVVLLLLQPERLRLRDASPSSHVCGGAEACLQSE